MFLRRDNLNTARYTRTHPPFHRASAITVGDEVTLEAKEVEQEDYFYDGGNSLKVNNIVKVKMCSNKRMSLR